MLRGEALRELGRNAEALAAFEQARDEAPPASVEAARAWYEIATVQRLLSRVDAAWQALDLAEPVAARLGETRWQSAIHYLRGNLCFARGDGAGCAREHTEALALAHACGDALAEAQALSGLGDAHYAAGRMQSAVDAFARCVAACERAGALRFAVTNRAMLGWSRRWSGQSEESLRELEAAGQAAVAMAHRNAEAMVTESRGLLLSWSGDPEARPTLERAIRLSHEVGMRRFEMISRVGLAGVLRRDGAHEEALAMAREAWAQCVEVGAQAFAGPLVLIEIAAGTPDPAEAEDALREAERLLARGAVAHNNFVGVPEAMRIRLRQGRHDEVLRLADALEARVRDEPNLWVTHHVAVARCLVRAARGPLDAELRAELEGLRGEARRCLLRQSEQDIERALAGGAAAA